MSAYSTPQIAELTTAVVAGYPAASGQARVRMLLLQHVSVDFDQFATATDTFGITLNGILLNLNQARALDTLLDALVGDGRQAVTQAIAAMRAAPAAAPAPGFAALAGKGLLVQGIPFVDRDILTTTIMPRLTNSNEPLRAVVMTGPVDCGKTFSVGLIRQLCNAAPPAARFRVVAVDLAALALTRDCMEVARQIGSWLRLGELDMPRVDTSEPRLGRRLVDTLAVARAMSDRPTVPTILVFDHLDKDIAPGIIDFAEELALAAADGRLQDVRVVLIGFPRAPSPAFASWQLYLDQVVQPNPALVFEYMDRALDALDRDIDDAALQGLVDRVFAGQQQPYPRAFMVDLPARIRSELERIMQAPTS